MRNPHVPCFTQNRNRINVKPQNLLSFWLIRLWSKAIAQKLIVDRLYGCIAFWTSCLKFKYCSQLLEKWLFRKTPVELRDLLAWVNWKRQTKVKRKFTPTTQTNKLYGNTIFAFKILRIFDNFFLERFLQKTRMMLCLSGLFSELYSRLI